MLQAVTTAVCHADTARELELQRFAPLLKTIEETLCDGATVFTCRAEESEEELGDSTGFDDDSDSESDNAETEEDRAFIDDEEEEELYELSFYRTLNQQWPEDEDRTQAMSSMQQRREHGRRMKGKKLISELKHHVSELMIIGFNSTKYDLNVLKDILVPHLANHSHIDLTIERNHAYLALKSGSLKFIDISNFLAAGTSYTAFLKAYQCQGEKGFFPYEYIKSVSQLEECHLPPREAFKSWLKNTELSEED